MGGTIFDTTIITEGKPQLLFPAELLGYPLQTSWIDVRSIGAGGGSIAHLDSRGGLKVGREAQARCPVPRITGGASVQRTVTDAALLLGMLGVGRFESGLSPDRAEAHAAISSISGQMTLAVEETARAIIAITTAAMDSLQYGGVSETTRLDRGLAAITPWRPHHEPLPHWCPPETRKFRRHRTGS